MRYRSFLLGLVVMLFGPVVFATSTKISGTIANGSSSMTILYPDPLLGEFEKQEITIYQGGLFSIELDIMNTQIITIGLDGMAYLNLFVAPGKDIVIDADALVFPKGVRFSGEGGADNHILQQYYEMNPPMSDFRKSYYKVLGKQFPFKPKLEALMNFYHPDKFSYEVNVKFAEYESLKTLPSYENTTPEFQVFFDSEIESCRAYALISYEHIYGNREKIEPGHFRKNEIQHGDIVSKNFRNYLVLNNLYKASIAEGERPRAQIRYRFAQKLETERAKEYLLSEIILDAIRQGDEETLMLFEEFLTDYPDSRFLDKIEVAVLNSSLRKFGEVAPNFLLEGTEGNIVSLNQFQGKVVYLDFWASWCKPCLEKMDKLEIEKDQYQVKDVVFITISLDANKDIWKRTLAKRKYSGVHLYAGKTDIVLKNYGVTGVPMEFIVKKNGEFAPPPSDSDTKNLLSLLDRLSN